MDPVVKELNLFGPSQLAASIKPFLVSLVAEVAVAVWVVRSSKKETYRLRGSRWQLFQEEQGWLFVPILIWAFCSRPPFFDQGLIGPCWNEIVAARFLHLFGCFLALSMLLFFRSVWLTVLGRPASSAGLAPMQVAVFTAVFFNILLVNLVPTIIFYNW